MASHHIEFSAFPARAVRYTVAQRGSSWRTARRARGCTAGQMAQRTPGPSRAGTSRATAYGPGPMVTARRCIPLGGRTGNRAIATNAERNDKRRGFVQRRRAGSFHPFLFKHYFNVGRYEINILWQWGSMKYKLTEVERAKMAPERFQKV